MSRVSSRSARAVRRVATPPAVAGFRPAGAALAVAAAFVLLPGVQAQPAGGQAIHGQASFTTQGNNLLVTTRNGAGTSHSAINWQSFSVPGGSLTHFQQPTATSTSINRVLGPDPSAIFGTLSSNGRLVLVNPNGIAVGAGAVVDTNGFTASTLRMTDADALAGRLRFSGGGGPLSVEGRILARSGDIVLVAPRLQVGAQGVLESQDGATLLAAGQKVEITGRGLEGIHLEVQAGNEAVNLGTLKGDAVGMFAQTLKHSGLVQAQAVRTEGGKVVLQAIGGDALVDGSVTAAKGSVGGSIDVLGQRVGLLAGANIDASGAAGGGQVRVGGDYQGANAQVPNAAFTYVDAAANIKADATLQGDGGRVIVWADEATRMHGRISARGGAQGGDGGFAEVSGKQYLEFTGSADLRAPRGKAGTLLLDPNDIMIEVAGPTDTAVTQGPVFGSSANGTSKIRESDLEYWLGLGSVIVTTNPSASGGTGMIYVASGVNIEWSNSNNLGLQADKGIDLQGSITGGPGAAVSLQALNGGVVQNAATSVVKVASLLVNAQNGGVSMEGANEVDTLAAATAGAGNAFFFRNAKALTIGSVGTPYGSPLYGINAVSGANAGAVRIVTTSGNLNVAAPITGGSVDLQATGAGANIDVGDWIMATTGPIEVEAAGSITGPGIYETYGGAGGFVRLQANGGDVSFDSIYTYGKAPGAQGGNVDVIATGSIRGEEIESSYPYFYIDAGGESGAAGQNGGKGGNVTLRLGGDLGPGDVYSSGGYGGDGAGTVTGNGGSGGRGGDIVVEHTAGDLRLSDVYFHADGGSGGSPDSSQGVEGSAGGGGNIHFQSGGKVLVDGAYVSAYGGYVYSTGGYGAMGNLSIAADAVEVNYYLGLDAVWEHTGLLDVLGASDISGDGVLRNKGQINLHDQAGIYLAGLRNEGTLSSVAGTSMAYLTENTGTVKVLAGTSLLLPGFLSNAGMLKVDGQLDLAPAYDPCMVSICEEPAFAAASLVTTAATPGAFVNEATGAITGTGTVVVDGGTGTIHNLGFVDPAGQGAIGTLTIQGNLEMGASSTMAVDILSPTSHDVLNVSGTVTTGGSYAATYSPATAFAAGTSFNVLQSGALDATTVPVSTAPELQVLPTGTGIVLQALSAVPAPPPPPPAPPPPPPSEAQPEIQQVNNQVITFAQLFIQEALQQQEDEARENGIGRDDIVVTDTACKPS